MTGIGTDAPERDRPTGLRRWAFLATPGWITMTVIVLGFAAACFLILAPWQFGRNAERSAQNSAVQSAVNATPVPPADLMSTADEPSADAIWRPITTTGVFEPDRQVYVRLRQDSGGDPVSEVILPLRLADGRQLLVDRGYVSFDDVQAGVPLPAVPSGTVSITGRVQVTQTDPRNRAPVAVDGRIEAYAISPVAVAAGSSADRSTGPFLRGYVQLTPESPGALTPIGLPQVDSGPFLSYALQWCAFGIIALIGLGVFVFREATGGRPEDDHAWTDGSLADRARAGPPDAGALPAPAEQDGPVAAGASRKRRSRDGFDRSQLYD